MNYFADIDLFAHLSENDQKNFSDFCQLQWLSKWEILFKEGDEPQAVYIIKSGRVVVQKLQNGEQKNIAVLWDGDIVGEMAFFWDPPLRNATVIADATSQVIVMLKFSMQEMMRKYPDLHEEIKNIIEQRSV